VAVAATNAETGKSPEKLDNHLSVRFSVLSDVLSDVLPALAFSVRFAMTAVWILCSRDVHSGRYLENRATDLQ